MNTFTIFAGWGPCGALNAPGETEFFVGGTILLLLALGVSELLVLLANSRFITPFYKDKSPQLLYVLLNSAAVLIKVAVAYVSLIVLVDFVVGDANLGAYDGDIPCDPIDGGMVAEAFIVLGLSFFLGYWQYAVYRNKRNSL